MASSSGSDPCEKSKPLPKTLKSHCCESAVDDEEENQKSETAVDDEEENQKSDDNDSDSDDSEEEDSDGYGDGLHEMTKKEAREYCKSVKDSGGFDVPEFPNVFALGIIMPYFKPAEEFKDVKALREFDECSRLAIEDFNCKEGTNYKFVRVSKVNAQVVSGFMYYITVVAKDGDGPPETFEAKVYSGVEETEVLLCRRKKDTGLAGQAKERN